MKNIYSFPLWTNQAIVVGDPPLESAGIILPAGQPLDRMALWCRWTESEVDNQLVIRVQFRCTATDTATTDQWFNVFNNAGRLTADLNNQQFVQALCAAPGANRVRLTAELTGSAGAGPGTITAVLSGLGED